MNIKKTIEDWAASTFPLPSSSCQVSIEQLPSAPPILFTVQSGSGYCITIKPVSAFSSPATRNPLLATAAEPLLGFWIPESGAQGSQCAMKEGDDEILTCAVDWSKATRTDAATGEETPLVNEDALMENLATLFSEFLRDEILLPALEKQLDDNAIAHEPFTIDMVGGIEPWDEKNWTFLFLPEPESTRHSGSAASVLRFQSSAIGGPAVLGLTGDGRAALFSYSRHEVDPRGYVDHIHLESQATGIDSPAALFGVWERINNPHWNSPEFEGNSSLKPPATDFFNGAQA